MGADRARAADTAVDMRAPLAATLAQPDATLVPLCKSGDVIVM